MMLDWQTVIVVALIAASAGVVVWRTWEVICPSDDGECGGCEKKHSRASDSAPIRRPFVSIESLEQRRHL